VKVWKALILVVVCALIAMDYPALAFVCAGAVAVLAIFTVPTHQRPR
jgi:hypothetical protein